MKKASRFIKETILTGVVVIIPIAVIIVILADLFITLKNAIEPLTAGLNVGSAMIKLVIVIILLLIILGVFFFIGGLILKTYAGNKLKDWFEEKVLFRIPMYKTLSGVTKQFTGIEKEKYPIAEVDLYGSGVKMLGLVTETLDDGRYLVYTPFSPLLNVGQLHIVPKDKVEVLDIPFASVADIITRLGFEGGKEYKKKE